MTENNKLGNLVNQRVIQGLRLHVTGGKEKSDKIKIKCPDKDL